MQTRFLRTYDNGRSFWFVFPWTLRRGSPPLPASLPALRPFSADWFAGFSPRPELPVTPPTRDRRPAAVFFILPDGTVRSANAAALAFFSTAGLQADSNTLGGLFSFEEDFSPSEIAEHTPHRELHARVRATHGMGDEVLVKIGWTSPSTRFVVVRKRGR